MNRGVSDAKFSSQMPAQSDGGTRRTVSVEAGPVGGTRSRTGPGQFTVEVSLTFQDSTRNKTSRDSGLYPSHCWPPVRCLRNFVPGDRAVP